MPTWALLDGERALHAAGLVAGYRAVELVGPGLQRRGDLRGSALAHHRPVRVHAVALDRDVVRDRGLVRHDESHAPGARRGLAVLECQRSAGIGRDADLPV